MTLGSAFVLLGGLEKYESLENLIATNPVVPRLSVKQPFGDPESLVSARAGRERHARWLAFAVVVRRA